MILFNSGTDSWCYRIRIDGSCASCSDTCSSIEGRKGADASEFPGIILTGTYTESSSQIRPISFSPARYPAKRQHHGELLGRQYEGCHQQPWAGTMYLCRQQPGGEVACN